MAAPKAIRRKAGDHSNTLSTIEEQVNLTDVLVAVDQLQETVNRLSKAFNEHTHGGITAGSAASDVPSALISGGTAVAAQDLFITADQ